MKCTSKRLLEELSNTGIREMNWLTKLQKKISYSLKVKFWFIQQNEIDWFAYFKPDFGWLIDMMTLMWMCFLGTTVSWAVSATALECGPSPPPTVERWTVCLSAGETQHTMPEFSELLHLHNLYSLVQLAGFCDSTSCRVSWSIQTASFI